MRAILVLLLVELLICSCAIKPSIHEKNRSITSEVGDDLNSRRIFLNKTTSMELTGGKIYVLDSSKTELEELKSAIMTVFHTECTSPVENKSVDIYWLEISSCLPIRITNLLGTRTRAVPGPNCYSYALYSLGIVDPIRRVKEDSFELFFNNHSSFCQLIPNDKKRPGDVVYLGSHAFIYLTGKYALSAAGAGRVYEITTNRENLDLAGFNLELKDVSFFRCKIPSTEVPSVAQTALDAIIKFESYLQKFLFTDGLTQENLISISKKINTLEKELTNSHVKILLTHSKNPIILSKLYSLIGMYYTISKISHRLGAAGEAGGTKDIAKEDFFRPAHLTYVKVLNRLAEVKHSIIFDSYTISVAGEFCSTNRKEIYNLCTLYDLHNKGELKISE